MLYPKCPRNTELNMLELQRGLSVSSLYNYQDPLPDCMNNYSGASGYTIIGARCSDIIQEQPALVIDSSAVASALDDV